MARLPLFKRRFRLTDYHPVPDRDVHDEIAFHLAQKTEDLIKEGLSPEEADRRAREFFGDIEPIREKCAAYTRTRTRRKIVRTFLGNLFSDLRFALRALSKRTLLTTVAMATLGLGIGANKVIFSVVNGVLLRPLPYPDPDRLLSVRHTDSRSFSFPEYEAWLELNPVFEELGIFSREEYRVVGGDHPEQIPGAYVTSGVFSALDVQPLLGRTFIPEDDQIGAPGVAVLSYSVWQRSFGAVDILGQTIHTHEGIYTVVGVMPPGFTFPAGCDIWTTFTDGEKQSYGSSMAAIARLRSGMSIGQAHIELESITERIAVQLPTALTGERDYRLQLIPYLETVVGSVRLPLLILLGVVGVVLLIACTNIANLLLVRATEQYRELAVRSALGAGRGRLLTQLVGEGVVLSLMGGLIGFCLAFISLKPFLALLPAGIPRVAGIGVDHRVLVFGILLSIFTGLCVGVLSAFGVGRIRLLTVLQGSGHGLTSNRRWNRLLSALVVSEIALTFVLFVGAGLLVKSFVRLTSVDPGFELEQMLTLWVAPPEELYDSEDRLRTLYLELAERLEAIPGVEAVTSSSQMPFADGTMTQPIVIGEEVGDEAEQIECSIVTASYFQVMGIPITDGRAFTSEENLSCSTPAIVISQAMADRYWPDREAVGQRVRYSWDDSLWFTVVGVAGDVHHQGLNIESHPKFYVPLSLGIDDDQTYVIKTRVDPSSIATAARDAIWAIDRDILVTNVSTLEDLISRSVASPRFLTIFLSLFAALAAVIVLVGTFGVLAYSVIQRTHEIGIRMALGAGTRDVMRSVLRRGFKLAGTGLAIGLVVSLFTVRVLKSFLFEISPTDPLTLVAIILLFTAIALTASYIPARRATRLDPMVALKHE